MGSLGGIMKMIPGMNKLSSDQLEKGETELKRAEAMIGSMTLLERKDPDLLSSSPSRRRRIARGSGHTEKDVGELVSKFQQMRTMMQQLGQGNFPGGMGGLPGMGGMPGMPGMGGGRPQPGWRGGGGAPAKKKKDKKKKGFGTL